MVERRHLVLTCLFLIACSSALASQTIVFEVEAGRQDRENTPIFVSLPQPMWRADDLRLTRIDNNAEVAVQILSSEEPQAVWILRDRLLAGQTRQYRLEATDTMPKTTPLVTCADNGEKLLLSVGEKPILKYQHAVKEAPDGIDPVYRRSGYIHPVFTPSGRAITDDFPPDEPHQHGVFFAWVNTTVAGHNVNFWDPKARTGQVGHSAIEKIGEGDVFADFRVALLHLDITNMDASQPVFNETWTVRAYNLDRQFLIDFESVQTCVADSCTVNMHYYGGMAFRGLRSWFDDQSVALVTSEGRDQRTGNESRPKWVRMSGPVESDIGSNNKLATLLVMGHPSNFRADQPVRLHPDKPYFCFAPMIIGPFTIAGQQSYISRYRFSIFDGENNADTNQRAWTDYAEPPTVRILPTDDR
jgi:methane monooxygenase PmoA-like